MKHYRDISKWLPWPSGSVLVLEGKRARRVRLRVAVPQTARITLDRPNGVFPLAVVDDRDMLELFAEGDVRLAVTDVHGEPLEGAWFATVDGDQFAIEADPEEYTRIWQRRPRNLEFERMMSTALQGVEARFSQALHDQEARHKRERAADAEARKKPVDSGKGAAGDEGEGKAPNAKAGAKKPDGDVKARPPAKQSTGAEDDEEG